MNLLDCFFYIIQLLKQLTTAVFIYFVKAPYDFIYPFSRYISTVICNVLAVVLTLAIYVLILAAVTYFMCIVMDMIFEDKIDIDDIGG